MGTFREDCVFLHTEVAALGNSLEIMIIFIINTVKKGNTAIRLKV
jgi:hypothetical protein